MLQNFFDIIDKIRTEDFRSGKKNEGVPEQELQRDNHRDTYNKESGEDSGETNCHDYESMPADELEDNRMPLSIVDLNDVSVNGSQHDYGNTDDYFVDVS